MNPRRLLLLLALASAVLMPNLLRDKMVPLAEGTYIVAVDAETSVVVTVADDGQVTVDAPRGVHVILHYDDANQPMDEFEVVLQKGTVNVNIDATEDGNYRYDVTSSPALATS